MKLNLDRKWYEFFKKRPLREFNNWCLSENPNLKKALNLEGYFTNLPNDEFRNPMREKFRNDVFSEVWNGPINIAINVEDNQKVWEFDFDKFEKTNIETKKRLPDSSPEIYNLTINKESKLIVKGAKIYAASVGNGGELILENCQIKKLQCGKRSNIFIKKCWVGEMNLQTKEINNLTIESSWIFSILSLAELNPFSGSVLFSDVHFVTSAKHSSLFKGPQQFRNLRSHFEKIQNGPAASLMRAKELDSERKNEKGVSKIFSWIYWFFSNYGLNPGRPLIFLLGFFLITAGFVYSYDKGTLTPREEYLTGWQTRLKNGKEGSLFLRSIILPIQSMVNPFGLFNINKPLVPASLLGKLFLTIYGIVADSLIAFTIFGIRKRFKIQ